VVGAYFTLVPALRSNEATSNLREVKPVQEDIEAQCGSAWRAAWDRGARTWWRDAPELWWCTAWLRQRWNAGQTRDPEPRALIARLMAKGVELCALDEETTCDACPVGPVVGTNATIPAGAPIARWRTTVTHARHFPEWWSDYDFALGVWIARSRRR
jgi:hypothetical protein